MSGSQLLPGEGKLSALKPLQYLLTVGDVVPDKTPASVHSDRLVLRALWASLDRDVIQERHGDVRDAFVPTLKMVPLRLMFSISASLNLELHHLDIETAFLHGHLKEEIYMEQPSHFLDPQFPNYVCKVHKSLYSLKQSPGMWHFKLHTYLVSIVFKPNQISIFARMALCM